MLDAWLSAVTRIENHPFDVANELSAFRLRSSPRAHEGGRLKRNAANSQTSLIRSTKCHCAMASICERKRARLYPSRGNISIFEFKFRMTHPETRYPHLSQSCLSGRRNQRGRGGGSGEGQRDKADKPLSLWLTVSTHSPAPRRIEYGTARAAITPSLPDVLTFAP